MLEVLEMPEVIRCVLLCMLEAVEGRNRRCWRCVMCMPEAVEGGFCSPEVIRCKLLCMLEVVEGKVCLLEAIRCALLCTLEGRLCLPEVAGGVHCHVKMWTRCPALHGFPY